MNIIKPKKQFEHRQDFTLSISSQEYTERRIRHVTWEDREQQIKKKLFNEKFGKIFGLPLLVAYVL